MPDDRRGGADPTGTADQPRKSHVCPVWIGWLLVSPLRRLLENPETALSPLVSRGSTVVDAGCAMGFYSLTLARLVGPDGRVICVDVQQGMLDSLVRRASRAGLESVIEPRLGTQETLELDDLAGRVDLVTAFHVVHEAAYPRRFLGECCASLATGGRLLVAEPRRHVSDADFAETFATIETLGLEPMPAPAIRWSHSALFRRP
jgi:ubiquinone/menaquinone biosynthesis C-methylase UbiE